jgi:predicted O-methyltransferase YrrM
VNRASSQPLAFLHRKARGIPRRLRGIARRLNVEIRSLSIALRIRRDRHALLFPLRSKWQALSESLRLPAIQIDSITTVGRSQLSEPILEDICMAPFTSGLTHDDLGAVLRLAMTIRPRVICEIGTAHGNLTANLLCNCRDATVVTIDSPNELQTGRATTYHLNQGQIGRVYRKYGYQERVTQLFLNSLELDLTSYVNATGIDLAIIDACHDTDYVLNDFEKVRGFIRPGGVVLFHDTNPSQEGHLAGSYRACLLLRWRMFDVKWIQDTWWGYWRNPGGQEADA